MRKIPYGKQTVTEADIEAVVSVLKSDYLTQGPVLPEFEKAVAEYHNARYGVAFANGTAALHAAYNALGVEQGDEIVTSPVTFAATANGAVYCGGIPVLADIDLDTNCIDVERIEEKITSNTKVISPVALAGYPVELAKVRETADKYGCGIIYDAAHAIGSKRNGSFGMEYVDAAILSFHPVKHVATGEGGMVLTNSRDIYDRLIMFRTHGITRDEAILSRCDGPWYYEMVSLGFNYRMTEMQAALGISQFKRLYENLRQRNEVAKFYMDSLADIGGLIMPPDVGFEILESKEPENIHAYHLFTLRVRNPEDRKPLYDFLHENGILAQIHYIPLHFMPYYQKNFGYKEGDCPEAEKYYRSEISIPMFHNMEKEDMEYVAEKIKEFYNRK